MKRLAATVVAFVGVSGCFSELPIDRRGGGSHDASFEHADAAPADPPDVAPDVSAETDVAPSRDTAHDLAPDVRPDAARDVPPRPPACDADSACRSPFCAIDRCDNGVFAIPYAAELPVIDGVTDAAWGSASEVQEIARRIIGGADPYVSDDHAGEFQMMWDERALYFRARVRDDSLMHDDPGPDPSFGDDGVELFIDAVGSRKAVVNGPDNPTYNQVMFGYGRKVAGSYTQHRTAGIEFRYAPTLVRDGYVVEAIMLWSALGRSPPGPEGGPFGLDVHINDDDDGGERDRKWTWFGQEDTAWRDPRACARAILLPRPMGPLQTFH